MPTYQFDDGSEVTLTSKPTHKAVKNAQNLLMDFMARLVKPETLQATGDIQKALRKDMLGNPEIIAMITERQETIEHDQTIILATGWSIADFLQFENTASEDDYWGLYDASKEAMGKTAEDFSKRYDSGSFSIFQEAMAKQQTRILELEASISTLQPNTSSPQSTEDSEESQSSAQP